MTEQETIEEIFEYYKGRDDCASQESLVDMFREIQEVYGYIPAELKERMAREFCVKETFLNCIIQRYPSLKEQKITHTVIVCSGERCRNKNAAELLAYIRKSLKIQKNGSSEDGKVCLRTQNCLRHCRTSPNISVDGEIQTGMTCEKWKQILQSWS